MFVETEGLYLGAIRCLLGWKVGVGYSCIVSDVVRFFYRGLGRLVMENVVDRVRLNFGLLLSKLEELLLG